MNSAISNLRPHYSPIIKVILFFYFLRPAFFSSYYFFLSPFLVFLPSLILALRASNHFFALSLPLPLLDVMPPSLTKPKPKHQVKPISIIVVSFFASGQKNQIRVRYFSGWAGSGLQILTRFAMSSNIKQGWWISSKDGSSMQICIWKDASDDQSHPLRWKDCGFFVG